MNLKCVHYSKAVIRGGGHHSVVPNIDFFRMYTFELFNYMLFGRHEGAVRTPPAQRRRLEELCFQ